MTRQAEQREGPRVVFFGMNGAYSTIPLLALARAGFTPLLVVMGVHEDREPGFLERLRSRVAPLTRARNDPRTASDLAVSARALGIDVLMTSDSNSRAARARILRAAPDVLVVAGFPHLLAPSLLEIAARGGLNVHPGRLPEERGPSPVFWSLKEGRTTAAWTIHVLDPGEDSGDIVARGEIVFEPGTRSERVLAGVAESASFQLVRSVRALLDGDIVRTPQPREGRGRCPRPTFRDGLIQPSRSAREVYVFASSCAHVHSLFVECGGDRFFVEDAVSFDPEAKPPFEYALTGDCLILRCQPGVVELRLKQNGAIFSGEY